MAQVATLGIDIAKNVVFVHGVDTHGVRSKNWNAPIHRRLHVHHHLAKDSGYQMTSTR
jgi:hypothetical protein